ncbi:protein FAM200A [Trichonephila clavipes]|nr:protein FAM200A [Trichonephila clavipes]
MKPHTIGESLILPAATKMASIMHGDEYGNELKTIPLSRETVSRRISEMSRNIESEVIKRIQNSSVFALQLDETTDISKMSQLIIYVRFIFNEAITQMFLCCKGSNKGLRGLIQKVAPHMVFNHCMIDRQALAVKYMDEELHNLLQDAFSSIKYIECNSLNSRLFSILCNEMSSTFVEWAQNEIAVVPDFHKRILFSDEAHFWLNGYVNKQNCRIWSEVNPQVYVETPLHPEKLTVWCALWAGGIIGPYFFKNDEGHNVTVNGDRYRAMITNFSIPELNNHDVQELWFQQDGATCQTARATIDLLKDTFGDRLISRFGPGNWPPRSCDLTPLDYFLWGYVKSLVYPDTPQTLDHLEEHIRRVIADIRRMLEKVVENWTSRLDYIRASRDSHMPEIIFKM